MHYRLLQLTLLQWSHVRALLSDRAPLAAELSAMVWKMLLDHTVFPRTTMYVSPCSAVMQLSLSLFMQMQGDVAR